VLGCLRYFSVLLIGVFTVCPTLFVAASEPVRRIPSDHNVYPRLRYVVPVAMQESTQESTLESLPFDETTITAPTTPTAPQNLQNQNVNSEQFSPPIPRPLPSTGITQPNPQLVPKPTVTTNTPEVSNPTIPTPTVLSTPAPEPTVPAPVINNPFQYKSPDGDIGLIPRNISSLPSGIQVMGILMLKNQKSVAAIRLPRTANQRTEEIYYVHEGDIIEVPSNLLSNRRIQGSRGIDDIEILFLVVEKITPQHVEVRSRSNIADKHIIR
jgi:hypothetical protein